MAQYYEVLWLCVLIFLALGLLFAMLRAIRGPRIADRVVGVNLIGTLSTLCLAVLAVLLEENWLLDVCIVYCMVSFLAVLLLTKLMIAAARREEEDHD